VSKLALVLLLPCLGLGVWFFVARNSSYSWFLQDGMRLAFGLTASDDANAYYFRRVFSFC